MNTKALVRSPANAALYLVTCARLGTGLLLELRMDAEEVQGVLAHEMAHILKRHSTLLLAQNLGLDLAIQHFQGGESRLRPAMVRGSGQLRSQPAPWA